MRTAHHLRRLAPLVALVALVALVGAWVMVTYDRTYV
jgi:hypothetical protein